jgi:phosphoglycerate dehydrogenase-like enzyme
MPRNAAQCRTDEDLRPYLAAARVVSELTSFSCMKPSACVYNLGRGNAIDADALCRALSSASIAGAFLDVLPEEPRPPSSPLWAMPNLCFTPHASAVNAEYLDLYFEELEQLANLS